MKASQVREMSVADLNLSLKDNFEALENFRFRHAIGQLENYKSIPNIKKDIARIYTILKEKELKLNENMKKATTILADKVEKKPKAKKTAKQDTDEAPKEVKKRVTKKVNKEETE